MLRKMSVNKCAKHYTLLDDGLVHKLSTILVPLEPMTCDPEIAMDIDCDI